MSVLFLLATLAVCCLSAQQFQCDFKMSTTTMTNGGYISGVLQYDAVNYQMILSYTQSDNVQFYSWNTNGGSSTPQGGTTQYSDQYLFVTATGCQPGCTVSQLNSVFTPLSAGSALTPNTADGTTHNTPVSPNTNLAYVVLASSGYPTSFALTTNQTFVLSNCVSESYAATDATFARPSGCTCGKPIDVVLVLDRSSSILNSEFVLEKEFTQNLVAAFSYSDLEVNLGMTNFHTWTWDGPVNINQGNTLSNVQTGANALQCFPQSQCIATGGTVPFGSCCGSGTCISAGIVNGADMLATASTSGIRAEAAKILIVLTDGYHDLVLVTNPDGSPARLNGKPYGQTFFVNGTQCFENAGQTICAAPLLADLTSAVKYAKATVPGITIIGVGVGPIWSMTQLLAIADQQPNNVFGTTNWNQLSTLVNGLVAQTCQQSTSQPLCENCCGFCAGGCSGCLPPDGCEAGNFCSTNTVSGTCCNTVANPPTQCQGTDLCYTYSCDSTADNGAGACIKTPNPIKANTSCAQYTCNPVDGSTNYTNLCPPQPKCTKNSDCTSTNPCVNNVCDIPDASDPLQNYCTVTPLSCTGSNMCMTYSCNNNSAVGTNPCVSTANPIPPTTSCASYVCNPSNGTITYTNLCPFIPACTNDSGCNDDNVCTIDSCANASDPKAAICVFDPINCTANATDFCYTYTCDATAGCQATLNPITPDSNCSSYVCEPETGFVNYTNLCPPEPACRTDTDCSNGNNCTISTCVLSNASDIFSASCVTVARPASDCDDNNTCTYDSCVPTTGCVNTPVSASLCDDNDVCTVDTCNTTATNASDPCVHTPVVCNQTGLDICHQAKCYPGTGCQNVSVTCPTTDNCTLSGCNTTNNTGCFIQPAGTCGTPIAIVAGIAAGVVAGIVVAAICALFLFGAGGAAAYTMGAGAGMGTTVHDSPLYKPVGSSGTSPLNRQ